jgi:pimeloyl-ACP methyl ester carboxylesterase
MSIHLARNRSVEIAFETFGAAGGEPLLLIIGLDSQMLWWPDGFCAALVRRGFQVARFDNRDTGRSTHIDAPQRATVSAVVSGHRPSVAPYTADDMIDDGIAVLDAMGWESGHIVGASLGAVLALGTAVRHPSRVRTLTTMMALPGVGVSALRYLNVGTIVKLDKIRKLTNRQDGAVRTQVEIARLLSSPRHAFDEPWARRTAETSERRAPQDPYTVRHQLAAQHASRMLYKRIGGIAAPTLILHGADDPVVRQSAAAAVARRIPYARSIVYPAMGHEVPEHLWSTIADAITTHASRAGQPV